MAQVQRLYPPDETYYSLLCFSFDDLEHRWPDEDSESEDSEMDDKRCNGEDSGMGKNDCNGVENGYGSDEVSQFEDSGCICLSVMD